jgi:glutamate racemase
MTSATSPIAVFDSGVGGLTVLHDLLVNLPNEDYVYFADTLRFPFGERTQAELKAFSREIADHLVAEGAKLLVIACNSASSAAVNSVQAHLEASGSDVDVIGAIAPATQLAVAGSRSGRIGVLATHATVNSGAYNRAVHQADPHVTLESVACPELAPAIQNGFPFDAAMVAMIRGYCAPLKAAEVDTVILGCTHYPLVAPMLQRSLGRGVSLVTSGSGIARSVERALASRQLMNPAVAEGAYRFQCTADPDAFREVGVRFLQLPFGEVELVRLQASTMVAP